MQGSEAEFLVKIFGEDTRPLVEKTEAGLSTCGRDFTIVDAKGPRMYLRPENRDNAFVLIHEFAHVYHGYNFPELTEGAKVEQAEACAFLAEIKGAIAAPHFASHVLARIVLTGMGEAREIACRAAQADALEVDMEYDKRDPMRSIFGRILRGEFDEKEVAN